MAGQGTTWEQTLNPIGTQKQLFLDDHMVESLQDAAFVMNPAVKYRDNPVIRRDQPWEGNALHYGTVLYDDVEGRFRMWYSSVQFSGTERIPKKLVASVPAKTSRGVCYAFSEDGFHWEKPSLGRVEFEGSKENNLVGPEGWLNFKGGVFVDDNEADPARRFKAMARVTRKGEADEDRDVSDPDSEDCETRFVWNLYHSADAFTWTPHESNPVIDLPSRDGMRYDRRYRQPFIQAGDNGDFDAVTVYALQPIVHDDKIFIYYGGQNWRSSEQMDEILEEHGEDGPRTGIGLAVVPLDGFVSIDSGTQRYGEVVTRSFAFEGRRLQVNMRAASQGWGAGRPELKVELLAADHTPLPGYTFEEADTLDRTGLANVVSWKGSDDVGALAGKPIRLKLYSKSVKLFAFQFVE